MYQCKGSSKVWELLTARTTVPCYVYQTLFLHPHTKEKKRSGYARLKQIYKHTYMYIYTITKQFQETRHALTFGCMPGLLMVNVNKNTVFRMHKMHTFRQIAKF